jgi:hypothetical protein
MFTELTEEYLINGKRRGFLRRDLDTRTSARAINAMIFEGMRALEGSYNKKQVKEEWIEAVIRLMLDGIAA